MYAFFRNAFNGYPEAQGSRVWQSASFSFKETQSLNWGILNWRITYTQFLIWRHGAHITITIADASCLKKRLGRRNHQSQSPVSLRNDTCSIWHPWYVASGARYLRSPCLQTSDTRIRITQRDRRVSQFSFSFSSR